MDKNIAVVGAGFWGKNHVRNFYELGALHSVCDSNNDLKKDYESLYPGLNFSNSYSQILQNRNVKGVVIATPAFYHYQMAKEALISGKHVLVEKPLSLDVEEGAELVKLAKNKGLTLMVGHILRYHPAIIKLKELIDKGELGRIEYIYSNRLNIGKIRTEENILWSFAPHDISVILYLLNESPVNVYATGGSYLQHNIPDITITAMNFRSRVKAHVFVSWLHPFKEQKFVVVGDKKMAVFDDLAKEKLILYPHKIEWIQRVPVANKADAQVVPFEMEEPLKAQSKHFVDCLINNKNPKTDGNEGLQVLKVLQACQESLNRNGTTVSLTENLWPETSRGIRSSSNSESGNVKYFIHESAYKDENVEIGDGTQIWHFSHVLKGSRIGKDCKIGQNVVIGPNVSIGNNCKIQNNISVYEGVTLEDDVFCGPSMVFTNVINPRSEIPRMNELKRTLVKRGATMGANCTIICGVTIGQYAFVGAGAVVTKDVPDYALVVGVPAHLSDWLCRCGVKLKPKGKNLFCLTCGSTFKKSKGYITPLAETNKRGR